MAHSVEIWVKACQTIVPRAAESYFRTSQRSLSTLQSSLSSSSSSSSLSPSSSQSSLSSIKEDTHLVKFLKSLSLESYLPMFQKEDVTYKMLLDMTEKDLQDMGIPFGTYETFPTSFS